VEKLAYSIEEAKALVPIGRTKYFELIASGQLESITVGRRRLITAESLRRFVERLAAEQNPARSPHP
jgi:excisionase family DNA binding protein